MTVPTSRLVEDWIAAQRSEQTRKQYRTTIRQWHEWLAERGTDLLDAGRTDADSWRIELERRGRSGRTVNVRLAAISSLYDYAVDASLLDANPVRRVKRAKINSDQGETAALTEDEARRIESAAEQAGPRTHVAVALLLHLAIRVNELRTLDVSTIRLEPTGVTVRVNRKGGIRDVLPLTDRLADAVQTLVAGRKTGPLIQHEKTGAPWTYHQFLAATVAAGKRADVGAHVTPHVLRATWATIALSNGVPRQEVQEVLGHATSSMVDRYDRGRHDMVRKVRAITAVEGVLRAPRSDQ